MNSFFSSILFPLSTPLTTAPNITGRISSRDESTVIMIFPSSTSKSGEYSAELRKALAALAIVSWLNKSVRSGNISISIPTSSFSSTTQPIDGIFSSHSSELYSIPYLLCMYCKILWLNFIVGIVKPQFPSHIGSGRS